MTEDSGRRVAVVGAGMSGVAAAHFLKLAGHQPEILEAGASLGGRAGSLKLGDKSIDIGGKNIGRKYRLFREFLSQHGAPPLEFFGINSSTVHNGRLYTVDSRKKLSSFLHVLRLVGPRDFARLLYLASIVGQSSEEGMLGGARFGKLSEQKDHLPLSAWFRESTAQAFLRPITLRMNGAEPDRYFLGCFGSNLRMLFDSYDQLENGMGDLLDRFAQTLPISLNTRVLRLLRSGSRVVGVEVERNGVRERRSYASVVLSLPAPACARLLEGEAIAPALAEVSYNPVTLLVARYRRPIFDAKVRAIVFDAQSPLSNAGCYGINDLNVVRYTLSGRAAAGIDETADPAAVLSLAERELGRFVDVRTRDRADFVSKHFRHGLCAYGPYHHRLLGRLLEWERGVSGLAVTGDYLRGASIESCFQAAFECVERLTARVAELPRAEPGSLSRNPSLIAREPFAKLSEGIENHAVANVTQELS